MNEQLLDQLAHEAYEIEEDEVITEESNWCWEQLKDKKQSEEDELIAEGKEVEWRKHCLEQYPKDTQFIDEIITEGKKAQQWTIEIQKLEKEMENGALIEQESLETSQKAQTEEELFNTYSMKRLDDEIAITNVIKSIEQHNHVLKMDEVKEEIQNSVQDQQLTQVVREEMIKKYNQDTLKEQVAIEQAIANWYINQVGKQNTNPFFFSGYSRTYPCTKACDK